MDKIDLKIVRPFGPTYAYAKIPNNIVEKLNNYIDKIIKDKNKKKDLIMVIILLVMLLKNLCLKKKLLKKVDG